ncbi:MAG: hypothetical protein ACRDGQ_04910 [Candidatus Limnocylindrales bacterium]
MRRRDLVASAAVFPLLLSSLAGCSGPPGGTPLASGLSPAPYVLTVDDRSSWGSLQVAIGNSVVGHVDCEQTVMVAPGDPGVPPLPWTVRLVTASGLTVDQRTEDGAAGPRWLLVWDALVEEGNQPALGPVPECAMPSASIAPLPTAGLMSAAAIDAGARLLADRATGTVTVQTATIGRLATYATRAGVDPQTFVWALTFSGAFADRSTCLASPPATPCPSQASALVVLDFATGAELSVAVPAPQR